MRGGSVLRSRLIGMVATAGAITLMVLVFHPPTLPWATPLHVHLQAAGFGELNKNASVDLGGVKVGQVDQIRWSGGRAVLDLSIDPSYAGRIHRDASATIRPHGLLGPQYIDLDGGRSGTMPEGGTIPLDHVHVAVQLDEVLNALQPDVRENLKTFLVELANGSDGRGQDVNDALKALGQSSSDLRVTADTLQQRDQDLGDFFVYSEQLNREMQYAPIDAQIRDTDPVLAGLVAIEDDIGTGIDHTANVMYGLNIVMDGNSGNLATALSMAPGTITRLRTALAAGDQLVVGINPSLPSLMTAVVYTKSAFSYTDANGHYVKVLTVTGAGTIGLPQSPSNPGPNAGPNQPSNQQSSGPPAPPAPAPAPTATLSDQQLINSLMGH